jgi:hypothetical protein
MADDRRPVTEPAPRLLSLRRLPAVSLLLLLALPGGSSDLEVRAKDGRVTVRVRAAPLVDVLERLSRETGLELVFEGRKPSQLVTVQFDQLPEAEALSQLLEGLGIDYAFYADPTGQHVKKLFVQGASTTAASSSAATTASRGGGRPPGPRTPEPIEPEVPDEPFPGEGPGEEAEEPAEALPGGGPPDLAPVAEGSGLVPYRSPGATAPGMPPAPIGPGQASSPLPTPAFPGAASLPGAPPPVLPPPVIPGDASTPD